MPSTAWSMSPGALLHLIIPAELEINAEMQREVVEQASGYSAVAPENGRLRLCNLQFYGGAKGC
jgi:hypothetical protein